MAETTLSVTSASKQKSAVRFGERAELLDFLLEVAAVTSETLELDRLLANVAEIVQRVIPYEVFAILLYSERQRGLRIRYSIGHRDEVVRNLIVRLGEGVTGTAAAERRPVLVGDVRADPRYLNALDAVRSELAVPMTARGKLVGVIDIQSTRLDAYTDQDQALLTLLASRVAFSIDNAQLYRRVERHNRTLRILTLLAQEFSLILELDALLGRIAQAIRTLVSYDAFSVLLVDNERKVLRHRFSQRFDERIELDNIPLGQGVTGAAAVSREPVRVEDTLEDSRYIACTPDVRSEVAVPLIVHDRVIGVMDLESSRVGHFTEEHVRMLSLLAPQIAISVENARLYEELASREQRMEQDLRAARKLQRVLLPRRAPAIAGLQIGIGLRPAREISGDIYDFFENADGTVMLAFGDSSGKGAAAALYGALVSGLLRTLAPRRRGPALLMRAINEALLERKVDAQYVALLLLLWNPETRRLTMANAGGIPPLIHRDGEILRPRVEGVPLGLLDDREYEEVGFQTQPGDVIVLYSDGIQDQTSGGEDEYGRVRLAEHLRKVARKNPQAMVTAILGDIDRFRDGVDVADDQTLIVMKVS